MPFFFLLSVIINLKRKSKTNIKISLCYYIITGKKKKEIYMHSSLLTQIKQLRTRVPYDIHHNLLAHMHFNSHQCFLHYPFECSMKKHWLKKERKTCPYLHTIYHLQQGYARGRNVVCFSFELNHSLAMNVNHYQLTNINQRKKTMATNSSSVVFLYVPPSSTKKRDLG